MRSSTTCKPRRLGLTRRLLRAPCVFQIEIAIAHMFLHVVITFLLHAFSSSACNMSAYTPNFIRSVHGVQISFDWMINYVATDDKGEQRTQRKEKKKEHREYQKIARAQNTGGIISYCKKLAKEWGGGSARIIDQKKTHRKNSGRRSVRFATRVRVTAGAVGRVGIIVVRLGRCGIA
jgi:hypothetical protein